MKKLTVDSRQSTGRTDRNIQPMLRIALWLLVGAASARGGEEGEKQVLFWIRAGALSPPETEGDPDQTPRLRELVLEGVTAVELILSDPPSFDPKAIAANLFDRPSREAIRERRGAPVAEVGPQSEDPSRAAPPAAWTHPVVGLLEKWFGKPSPPSDDEDASIQRIRAALAGGAAAIEPGSAPRNAAPQPAPDAGAKGENLPPDAGALEIARQAIEALKDGAPLVIALEQVVDPARWRERDAALGWLASSLRGQDTFLIVLSARGGGAGPSPVGALAPSGALAPGGALASGVAPAAGGAAAFTVVGPGVRRGVMVGERKPLAAAAATAFRLLGVLPPSNQGSEAIDALRR